MLPYVKIDFKNGSLGGVEPMDDGVTLAIIPGLNLEENIDLDVAYSLVNNLQKVSYIHSVFVFDYGAKFSVWRLRAKNTV